MLRRFWILFILFLLLLPVHAQDDTDSPETGLSYGGRLTGTINNSSPRAVYYFDGLRGEVVSIRLTAASGDLDPVLTVLDESGELVLNLDDSGGSRDVTIEALRIPRTSRYYLIVGRFGFGLGSTSGDFQLDVERIGVSSASGSALRYGDTVINSVTSMTPQFYYSFRAERGDIVNIHMQRISGNLDPYLQVVDSNAFLLADNDDTAGASPLDAFINGLVIEKTGTYIIKATRYGEAAGTSTGSFVLSLEQAQGSGLGNSVQTAIPIAMGGIVEGEITNDNYNQYFVFEARQNDLITVRMSRLGGALDSFLSLANAGLQQLAADDDSGGGQNAKIEGYLIPADGKYYIVASRLEGETGKTVGRYRLELQSLGSAFDGLLPGVQRISYGTTVTGRIDDQTPETLFAFYGFQGDAVSVSVNRGDGDLDPVVTILDSGLNPLTSDDDSGGGQNARIGRFVLPESGLYYVRAGRYSGTDGNPNTRGSFVLVLARVFS